MKALIQLAVLNMALSCLCACQKEETVVPEEVKTFNKKGAKLNIAFKGKSKVFDSKTISTKTEYAPRSFHTSVVFKDAMWIIGGTNVESSNSDVWFSANGTTWNTKTEKAGFSNRFGHAATVFKDKMWVVGGTSNATGEYISFNDVWCSASGKEWKSVASDKGFTPRRFHTLTTFKERMWIIGGISEDETPITNKILSSADGKNWLLVDNDPPFGNRYWHTTLVFDDKLWVIGGNGTSIPGPESASGNEVWYSENGFDWFLATADTGFIPRAGHTTVSDGQFMWVIGGYNGSQDFYHLDDIWRSDNGIDWEKVSVAEPSHKRAWHTSLFFDYKIWVIDGLQYGSTGSNNTLFYNYISNIWYMVP